MLEPLFECKFTPPLESPEPPKAEPIRNLKATITIDGVETEITPDPRIHELEEKCKDEEHINDLCANVLIKSFDKMVEKYNLKHFVKQVEETGGNPFIAIMPFITDHEDLSNYHHDLVCCPL